MPEIDPTLPPVAADELARDSPEAVDAPILKEAEKSGEAHGRPVEDGLTTLPPD